MDKKLLKLATETMRELSLSEIRLKDGECEVFLRRSDELSVTKQPNVKNSEAGMPIAGEGVLPSLDIENEIRAPIIGIFHRGEEGKAPYVNVGDSVKRGDVLCVIEAMKMNTQVFAEFNGIVDAIYADDGSLVEFGQLLFAVRRS